MMISGISCMTDQACGSLQRGWQKKFETPGILYEELEAEGFFSVPLHKVRWLHTVSQRYCLAAALTLRDAFESSAAARIAAPQVGILSLNRDGALRSNLDYFKDYVQSGRKLARGNLFIHTLPTSPLAEVAITFGLKGPLFHLSASEPEWNLLFDRSEALGQAASGLNLLCCAASEHAIICFFLSPDGSQTEEKCISVQQMKSSIGNLWDLKDVFRALKIETEMARS